MNNKLKTLYDEQKEDIEAKHKRSIEDIRANEARTIENVKQACVETREDIERSFSESLYVLDKKFLIMSRGYSGFFSEDNCPYEDETQEAQWWQEGWEIAAGEIE